MIFKIFNLHEYWKYNEINNFKIRYFFCSEEQLETECKIVCDTSKPSGDKKRIMNTSRAESIGIRPSISLNEGIKTTIEWYQKNADNLSKRYNAFTDKLYKRNLN